jgi:beta-glucanase (GH16 family)
MESYKVGFRKVFGYDAMCIGRPMVLLLFVLLLKCNLFSQPTTMWQVMEDNTIQRWVYVGGDEFEGNSFDHSNWYTCEDGWDRDKNSNTFFGGDGSGEDGQADQSLNIVQENGKVRLITNNNAGMYRVTRFHEDGSSYEALVYKAFTAGWIQPKMKYKYGLFEVRCKLPTGFGIASAFWMYGGYPAEISECYDEEFDIFEANGSNTNSVHINLHRCDVMQPNEDVNYGTNLTENYNTVIGSWFPNGFFWHRLGDYHYAHRDLGWEFKNNSDLILGTGVCTSGCVIGDPINGSTVFPSYFDIDYVRVWSLIDCEEVVQVCNYEQTNVSPTINTAEALTVYTGKQITFGGQNCNILLGDQKYLKLFATDRIELKSGFHAQSGSKFSTKLISCPDPFPYNSASNESMAYLKNSDTANAVGDKSLSANSPPKLCARVFPNPTDGKIRIEFSGEMNSRNMKIDIINANGQVVFSKSEFEQEAIDIDITELPKGTYILLGTFGSNTISEKVLLK